MIQAKKNLNQLQPKCYVIDSQTAKNKYNQYSSIKCETESIKSSFCDYSDASILVKGDISVTADNNRDVAFKNCAPFFTCKTEVNGVVIDDANYIHIAMTMYNLIEYNDNYSDTSESLWQIILNHLSTKQMLQEKQQTLLIIEIVL